MESNQTLGNASVSTPTSASTSAPKQNITLQNSEKKKGKGMVYGMILLAVLAAGGIGFGIWAMMDGNNQKEQLNSQISALKSQNNDLQEKLSESSLEENGLPDDLAKTCEGVYYGEASGTLPNGLSYDYKYTYTLNKDGTFTADFGGVSGTNGKYMINDNTISLISHVEIGGSRDETALYSTKDYVIADDCSLIKVNNSGVKFELKRQ